MEEAYNVEVEFSDNQLLLRWFIEPGYYLYKEKFKFKVDGQTHTATLEKGKVKYDEYFEKDLEVFYNTTVATLDTQSLPRQLSLKVTSQGCADAGLCYPPYHQYFDIDLDEKLAQETGKPSTTGGSSQNISGNIDSNTVDTTSLSDGSATNLWISLLFAVIGGAILNLMPCVFPVLSIKAISLSNAHLSPHQQHLHGWAYTLGCIATFVAIAAVMLALRAGGEAIGWGFQLQSPMVITLLMYLFFVMGLSFSGVINIGSRWMGLGQEASQGDGLRHSVMTGALASVVASPCTAPMMGSALGYAITQPTFIALLVFAALGFGMALPFLLLSYLPKLANAMPKPGAWMDTLKQALAFPLYLTSVWLLWVLINQTNSNQVALVATGLVAIAFAIWLLPKLPEKGTGLWIGRLTALGAISLALNFAVNAKPEKADELWVAYTPKTLQELREEGRAVLVNLTATWCITCLANEKVALSTDTVRNAMKANNVQGVKGDWTNADPQITELLNQYGRSGVPMYLYFPPKKNAKAELLPQLLTPEIITDAIQRHKNNNLADISNI
ncbi:hypothetical protein GCM10007877_09130 [Marinibactrum halimedae]|uniref:Cytochrome C biogenesis protein n=1 Tax=Marinibactrum halimedae TaxID=1444977 RepID=A0AA37T1G1_9GAMM|nr:hypothetical protein GCM10007877_09130 [Marinibactrum halimedae]